MKVLHIYAVLILSIFSVNFSFAQSAIKNETIKVWGNCGMCKATIEKAAKKAGAIKANWNEDSKELKVTYNVFKSSSAKIQKGVANAGYDTQDFTADNVAYKNLHGCCWYKRKTATETKTKCSTHENGGKEASCCKIKTDCKEKSVVNHKH
jgi:hypothetical protein